MAGKVGVIFGGVVLGAAVALGLIGPMGNPLYKLSPRDPLAFGLAFRLAMKAMLDT